MRRTLTVIIITFNEEQNIQRAIESASFADEILVVDSGSSDKTCEIASTLHAKVIHQPFLGYGQQKNFAEGHASSEWIYNLDADEEISPDLKKEIIELLGAQQDPPYDLYQSPRLNHYCGHPIYHGGWYPDLSPRLYKKGRAKWSEPSVHEALRPLTPFKGTGIGLLKGRLNHYTFSSLEAQVQTNIRYAKLASKRVKNPTLAGVLFWPCVKFFECYILKKGCLDGFYGLVIAINSAHHTFMKQAFAYKEVRYALKNNTHLSR